MIALGIRIRNLREAQGLSQQELAYESDIHQKTIQKIETAKLNPSFDTLVSLSEGLGVSLSDLMNFEAKKKP